MQPYHDMVDAQRERDREIERANRAVRGDGEE